MISRNPLQLHPGYVSGQWYSALDGALAGGAAASANTIRLLPFRITKPITVAALGAHVTVASASNNFQLAIYRHDPALGRPTGAALCSTGNLSTTSVAAVSGNVTSAPLSPGIYWAAVNQDNAAAAFQVPSNGSIGGYLVGSTTLANVTSGSGIATFWLTIAQAFGTWPDLTGGSFSEANGTGQAAALFLKAA